MSEIKYGRGKFTPSKPYIRYINKIADSPVYNGMPAKRSDSGKVNWQCSSGKSTSFYKHYPDRLAWWIRKADELGLKGSGSSDDRLTIAARMIHPTRKKVCLICGKKQHVGYMYMNANYAKKWNKLLGRKTFKRGTPIDKAAKTLVESLGRDRAKAVILADFPEKKEDIPLFEQGQYEAFFSASQYIPSTRLSPGYMGDCPHRLDGLHDYCIYCCKKNDPGRSDENMRTYSHDRRAFQYWVEGNWKVADALYNSAGAGTCIKCGKAVRKISPDHVGPLSCGFRQDGFFEPLCSRCNSSKNRRFTFDNVTRLLQYEEENGEPAASWQVLALWDSVKKSVRNDSDAKLLSNYMRAMQDYYLRALSYVADLGHYAFLTSYLHPEYAHDTITFTGLDTSTLTYQDYKRTPTVSTGSRSLAARSVRIAFEELRQYCDKSTAQRKSKLLHCVDDFLAEDRENIKAVFSARQLTEADRALAGILTSKDDSTDSTEHKDEAVQTLMEAPEFQARLTCNSDFDKGFRVLIDGRGRALAEKYLSELRTGSDR